MTDLNAAETVEIRISNDGRKLWIDTENGNVCRIYNIKQLIVTDARNPHEMGTSEGS